MYYSNVSARAVWHKIKKKKKENSKISLRVHSRFHWNKKISSICFSKDTFSQQTPSVCVCARPCVCVSAFNRRNDKENRYGKDTKRARAFTCEQKTRYINLTLTFTLILLLCVSQILTWKREISLFNHECLLNVVTFPKNYNCTWSHDFTPLSSNL